MRTGQFGSRVLFGVEKESRYDDTTAVARGWHRSPEPLPQPPAPLAPHQVQRGFRIYSLGEHALRARLPHNFCDDCVGETWRECSWKECSWKECVLVCLLVLAAHILGAFLALQRKGHSLWPWIISFFDSFNFFLQISAWRPA